MPKNMVRVRNGYGYVDWTGAGVGPRLLSLEWMLGPGESTARVMAGYAEYVTLTDEEWERLPGVAQTRHLVGLCFRLALAPDKAAALVKRLSVIRRNAKKVAEAARKAGK